MNDIAVEELCYADFIEETFIKPIRTVTLVDDEYPTMDLLISGGLSSKQEDNKELLKQLISTCRNTSNNWMLDVYDKIPNDDNQVVASRLHNSDFLILDYHLDGNGDDGPGWEALKILQQLASTPHFNLVAIYTKGYDTNIEEVIKDIICSLQKKPVIAKMHENLSKIFDKAFDDWSLEDDDIQVTLCESITDLDFLRLLQEYGEDLQKWEKSSQYICELKTIYDRKPEDVKISFPNVLKWVFNEKTLKLKDYFGDENFLNYGWDIDGNVNWVHSDQLFVTVVSKDNPIDVIPQMIVESLTKWEPHPHKLILTKLRHEIDEQGTAIANRILDKQYVHAHWLEDLLTATKDAIDYKAWTILCKHWDELAAQTKNVLTDFTLRLVSYLKNSEDGVDDILKKFTKPEVLINKNHILVHANCFNCSKPIEGYHLTTGHVLELQEGTSVSYWLCVTPACDLEPGQGENSLKNRIPITLQRLYKGTSACRKETDSGSLSSEVIVNRALEKATSKNILFLIFEDNDDVCVFSSIVNIYGDANPKLEEFYATDFGKFDQESNQLIIFKTALDDKECLIYKNIEVTVVAQLRYEYALEFLNKAGNSKSRIGLDFIKNG